MLGKKNTAPEPRVDLFSKKKHTPIALRLDELILLWLTVLVTSQVNWPKLFEETFAKEANVRSNTIRELVNVMSTFVCTGVLGCI